MINPYQQRRGRPLRFTPIMPEDYLDYLPMEHVHPAIRRAYYFGQDTAEPHGGMVSFDGRNEEEEAMIHALDGALTTRHFPFEDKPDIHQDRDQRQRINIRNDLVAFLSKYYSRNALARVFDMTPDQVSNLKSMSRWKDRPAPFLNIMLAKKQRPRQKPFYRFHPSSPPKFPIILTVPEFFNLGKLYADGELIPAHEIPFLRQNTWAKNDTHGPLGLKEFEEL